MKRTNAIGWIALFLAVIGVGCSAAHSERLQSAVAVVNGERIEAGEFRNGYVDFLLQTGLEDALRYRRHYLNSRIAARLLVQEARKQGLDRTAAYREAAARIEKKLLVDVYVQKALFDTLEVREDELKDMFVRAQTTLTARHLYARTLEEAEILHGRLMQGATFETLAKEVFADTVLANNAGSVGAFTLDDMDPAFEDAAFSLAVGEISRPVRTKQGYSIIQLQDRFTKPLITEYEYAEKRDRMEHFVSYRKKTTVRARHADELLAELEPAWNGPALERLLQQISGNGPAVSGEGNEAYLNEELVRFQVDGVTNVWRVADFRTAAAYTGEEQRTRVTDETSLRDFVHGLLLREEMVRRAVERGYDRMPDVADVRERALRDWLWDEATRRLYETVHVPEDTLRAHFEANGEAFMQPARTQIWEILVGSKKEADAVKQRLGAEAFSTLARRHSVRPGAYASGGDLGFLSADQLGILADPVQETKAGEVIGPLEYKGHYVLLMVGETQPARALTFSEAKPDIVRQLQPAFRKAYLRQHIDVLRAKSQVTIDEAMLAEIPLKTSRTE